MMVDNSSNLRKKEKNLLILQAKKDIH